MIFITGGTGFLGRELVGRLLLSGTDTRLGLLIRDGHQGDAASRVNQLLHEMFDASVIPSLMQRIEIISGDITLDSFGLGESEFTQLASRVTQVFHCAATTSLNQPLAEARASNVGGTEQVLKLARYAARAAVRQPQAPKTLDGITAIRFNHVSTAYVAGDNPGIVQADDLDLSSPFRNSYEQTKAEAEALVRAASLAGEFSSMIFRPSIIVGDSTTGRTTAFNVIYIPAKYFAKGFFSIMPGSPIAHVDLVPVNYVADAIIALAGSKLSESQQRQAVRCFHLCSGVGRETTFQEILEAIVAVVNKYRKKGLTLLHLPPIIPLEMVTRMFSTLTSASSHVKTLEEMIVKRFGLFSHTLPFIPYMTRNPRFDARQTAVSLEGILSPPPLFIDYAEKVFEYCLQTDWGKRVLSFSPSLMHWKSPLCLT